MTKALTPIQNVIVVLVTTLAGSYFPWIVEDVVGFPLSGETWVELVRVVFLAVAGWNLKSARAKYAGEIPRHVYNPL